MGILERRRLGITVRRLKEIVADIEGHDEMTRDELAAEVIVRIHSDTPGDLRDIDWDQVLEFIFRILPLILALL